MTVISTAQEIMIRTIAALGDRIEDRERGDVPGWVLITIMTAGLVTALWTVAQDALTGLFNDAVHGVTGGGGK